MARYIFFTRETNSISDWKQKEKLVKDKRGGNIGRLLVLEFSEEETDVFDEVMEVVGRHPDFKRYELRDEPALRFPGLEIYPDQRKIYCCPAN